jgi:hypothetical protein
MNYLPAPVLELQLPRKFFPGQPLFARDFNSQKNKFNVLPGVYLP